MSETEKYIKQYENAFNLRKTEFSEVQQKKFILDNIFSLLKFRIVTLISAVLQYMVHLWKYREHIGNIFRQKQSGQGRDVLIIGNGPSQGLLDLEFLNSFSKNGNDTMAINYWHLNKDLSKHIPTYMVFSDRASFDESKMKNKAKGLIEFLSKNKINIVAPVNQLKDIKNIKKLKENKFHGFVDVEFKGWDNIHPAFPRGYISMTMYKMLAFAIYKKYDNIYIIGMDNTYIRTLFNDYNNKLWDVEVHAGDENWLHRLNGYDSIASRLQDLLYLFSDLRKFKQDNIYNIDPYSLVDQFEKKDLVAEFKSNKR
jgi:hypothetical protein